MNDNPFKDEWGTPPKIFKKLNKEFAFTLDAAASEDHHLCDKYYTKQNSGLLQSWNNERVFVNPPYSDQQIAAWVKKAFSERNKAEVIVMLIPVRTDRKYFHRYILNRTEIRFVKERIRFTPLAGQNAGCPSFPNMLVIWKRDNDRAGQRSIGDFKEWIK